VAEQKEISGMQGKGQKEDEERRKEGWSVPTRHSGGNTSHENSDLYDQRGLDYRGIQQRER